MRTVIRKREVQHAAIAQLFRGVADEIAEVGCLRFQLIFEPWRKVEHPETREIAGEGIALDVELPEEPDFVVAFQFATRVDAMQEQDRIFGARDFANGVVEFQPGVVEGKSPEIDGVRFGPNSLAFVVQPLEPRTNPAAGGNGASSPPNERGLGECKDKDNYRQDQQCPSYRGPATKHAYRQPGVSHTR